MGNVVQAHTFVTSETLTAVNLNANPAAFVAAFKNIDNTNIGTAGVFASQIIPLNTAQSTFGGAVGYTFAPGSPTQVPLTVSGVAGQSVPVFQVSQTNGGNNAFIIDLSGRSVGVTVVATALALTSISLPATIANGDMLAQRSSTTGSIFLGGTSASGQLDFGLTTPGRNTLTGGLTLPSSTNPLVLGTSASYTSQFIKVFSGAGGSQFTDFFTSASALQTIAATAFGVDIDNATNLMALDRSGNLAIAGSSASKNTGTAWANLSDARIKENVADYAKGLDAILALRPVTYNFNGKEGMSSAGTHVGYLAQEIEAVHPEMVSIRQGIDFDDLRALDTSDIVPMLVNAVKALAQRLPAPQ